MELKILKVCFPDAACLHTSSSFFSFFCWEMRRSDKEKKCLPPSVEVAEFLLISHFLISLLGASPHFSFLCEMVELYHLKENKNCWVSPSTTNWSLSCLPLVWKNKALPTNSLVFPSKGGDSTIVWFRANYKKDKKRPWLHIM